MGLDIQRKMGMKALEQISKQKEKFFQAGINDDEVYESFVKSLRTVNARRIKARKRIYAINEKLSLK